jgi:hypothetical protein
LKILEKKVKGNEINDLWRIEMKDDMKNGENDVVDVEKIYNNIIKNNKDYIKKKEKKIVLYNGNNYLYYNYSVEKKNKVVKMGKKRNER